MSQYRRSDGIKFGGGDVEKLGRVLLCSAALAVILPAAALAADMPVKGAAPVGIVAPSWNNVYFGVNVGFGFPKDPDGVATTSATFITPGKGGGPAPGPAATGAFGENRAFPFFGLEIGQHHQFGPTFVLGWSADINWSPLTFGSGFTNGLISTAGAGSATFAATQSNRMTWFGTVKGTGGFLVTPSLLVFGAGGLAYGRVQNDLSATLTVNGAAPTENTVLTGSDSGGSIRTGWTAGGGFEWKLDRFWSFKAEYEYVKIGRAHV